jgi:hypothetical protein
VSLPALRARLTSEIFRDGIDPARQERIAADDPPNAQQNTPDQPEPSDRLMGIGRTRGFVPARPGHYAADRMLVTLDQEQSQVFHKGKDNFFRALLITE